MDDFRVCPDALANLAAIAARRQGFGFFPGKIEHDRGADSTNFEDITERLKAAGASIEVANEEALEAAVARLLADPSERDRMAAAADAFAASEAGVLDAVFAELQPFLEPLSRKDASHAGA